MATKEQGDFNSTLLAVSARISSFSFCQSSLAYVIYPPPFFFFFSFPSSSVSSMSFHLPFVWRLPLSFLRLLLIRDFFASKFSHYLLVFLLVCFPINSRFFFVCIYLISFLPTQKSLLSLGMNSLPSLPFTASKSFHLLLPLSNHCLPSLPCWRAKFSHWNSLD